MALPILNDVVIDRSRYDAANAHDPMYEAPPGVNETLVRTISKAKNEPDWMLQKRLAGLKHYDATGFPAWGPDISRIAEDIDAIKFFVQPKAKESTRWEDLPDDIRKTYERIGIPEAEKRSLSGVGAQYDSEIVYHNLKREWEEQGVVFTNMDAAVREHPELVKKHFMTQCVPPNDHKFVMLHAAVWSGGTFIYIPPGVKVKVPLQAYFRMNAERGGQFEHTLIIADKGSEVHYIEGCSAPQYNSSALHAGCVEIFVMEGARVRYSSVENWSRNTFNLNTKRALVDKDGVIEWVNGNLGSGTTMLYPCSVLRGEGARSDSLGIAFAGAGQHQDTGSKVIHAAPNTRSTIQAKSISKDGGVASYRGLVKVMPHARGSVSAVNCDALLLDAKSASNTYPDMKIDCSDVDIAHEASVGRIGDDEIFYLRSRGLSEQQARQLVVAGFIEPIVKQLPLEYSVELNKLIELEMEGERRMTVQPTTLAVHALPQRSPESIEDARALLRIIGEPFIPDSFIVIPHNTSSYTVTASGVIVLGPWSETTIRDDTGGDVLIIVGEGAVLHYRTAAGAGRSARIVYAMRGASVDWADAMAGDSCDTKGTVWLAAEGAQARFRGVFLGAGSERYATAVRMVHAAPKTSSHMLTRAALLDASRGSYRGLISILPDAHGCDAFQRADTLLIGEGVHMDALPVLEIQNDDVRCSHGVTMGRVSDERMFYLRSRGLPALDARAVLVQGFFDQVLISMGDEGKRLHEMFATRLAYNGIH